VSRPRWKLTVRSGPDVEHSSYDDLDAAVAAMREAALRIRADAPPKTSSVLGTYNRGIRSRRAAADRPRLPPQADGGDRRPRRRHLRSYSGGVGREELDPTHHETPFDLVRETLGKENE